MKISVKEALVNREHQGDFGGQEKLLTEKEC